MTTESFIGLAAVISAGTGLVTALGVIVVAVITKRQGAILQQVEKQGNSASLEFKRLIMVSMRRTAVATGLATDTALADDAEKVYSEALKAVERNGVKP